jgi:hypothetical protein
MRRSHLILIFLVLMSVHLAFTVAAQDTVKYSQPKKKERILDRMDFGGYLGAQFGDVTYIEVSPLASYYITENFQAGLGFTYQYYSVDYDGYPDYSSSAYGGSIFARYFVWRDLFAHVEYSPLYIADYQYPPGVTPIDEAPWAHDLLLGGGYRQWIGDRAAINLMLLFNVNETIYSPYSNPIIRIGFGIGL